MLSFCIYPYEVEQLPLEKEIVPSTYMHSHCWAMFPAGRVLRRENSNTFMLKALKDCIYCTLSECSKCENIVHCWKFMAELLWLALGSYLLRTLVSLFRKTEFLLFAVETVQALNMLPRQCFGDKVPWLSTKWTHTQCYTA